MKKFAILFVLFASLLMSITPVVAAPIDANKAGFQSYKTIEAKELLKNEKLPKEFSYKSYGELFAKNNIKDVEPDKVPKDKPLIKINSEQELQQYIWNSTNNVKTQTVTSLASTGVIRKETYVQKGTASIYLTADIQVYSSGSFGQINGSNEWTHMEGVTFSLEWKPSPAYHIINNPPTSINVYGSGTLEHYLLVDGMVKLWSEPVDLSLYYSIY